MFVHITDLELSGDKKIKFLDKGYVPAKEFKKNTAFTNKECYKAGVTDETFVQDGIPKGSRIYHVTI